MLYDHGWQEFCGKETLHNPGSKGVRRQSENHADPNDGSEVRQQFDAREDYLAGLSPASAVHPSFWQRAFGFCIESDLPLRGLPPCSPSAIADIRVHLPSQEKFPLLELLYRSPYLDADGE